MNIRTLILLTFAPLALTAQGTMTGAGALKLPLHAVGASTGDALVVSPGTLGAVQFNPANLLSDQGRLGVLFTHTAWVQDVQAQELTVSLPLPLGQGALGIGSTTVDGIEIRERPGPPDGTFASRNGRITAGWAVPVGAGIVGGISASYVYEKLYVDEASGMAWSLGLLGKLPVGDLTAGISLTDLGTLSAFRTERSDLPRSLRAGIATAYASGDFRFEPGVAMRRYLVGGETTVHAGCSVTYADLFTIRGRWQSGDGAGSLGFGLGAHYRGVGFEYALLPFSEGLGSAQLLSVNLDL